MGAFVGEDGFEVHHVAHNGVFVGDTHSTVDLAGFSSYFQGGDDVVAFCHRDLGGSCLSFIGQCTEAPGKQLSFSELGDHFGQFFLGELETTDGATELDAFLGVAEGGVVAV